jgi:hypothetical protein
MKIIVKGAALIFLGKRMPGAKASAGQTTQVAVSGHSVRACATGLQVGAS